MFNNQEIKLKNNKILKNKNVYDIKPLKNQSSHIINSIGYIFEIIGYINYNKTKIKVMLNKSKYNKWTEVQHGKI